MRHSVHSLLAVFCMVSAAGQAEALRVQRQPIVVYEGRSTVSAQPYYQPLTRKDAPGQSSVDVPDGAGVRPLKERLPLSPTQLAVGRPQMKTVPGLITPIVVMGMDEVSLTWFRQAVHGLADIGARGVVIQANSPDRWLALQQQARTLGIDLVLMDGDALARGYGIDSYPMVLLSPELAEQGSHE